MTKEEFKEMRLAAGWDVYECARQIGVTFGMVYKYEQGFTKVPYKIQRLMELLVCKFDDVRFPVLDGILTEQLENGARIEKQDGKWHLLTKDGNSFASGENISGMLENLIWLEG